MSPWIIDTGPLFAVLHEGDDFHEWAASVVRPFLAQGGVYLTTESVIAEIFHLANREKLADAELAKTLHALMTSGAINVASDPEIALRVPALIMRHQKMDPADASIVALFEKVPSATILTLDGGMRGFTAFVPSGNWKSDWVPLNLKLPDGR